MSAEGQQQKWQSEKVIWLMTAIRGIDEILGADCTGYGQCRLLVLLLIFWP